MSNAAEQRHRLAGCCDGTVQQGTAKIGQAMARMGVKVNGYGEAWSRLQGRGKEQFCRGEVGKGFDTRGRGKAME